ncbi:AsmA family protein [Jeongeupia chitinilytica]|uniref:Cell envelope biogenesis protein AsmA n=1 Tax=Jeongeupia chitinilytica TaxID=1041641 RepID=A0ABQ3GWW6_9NEIS|nr:AsmA family protein [Jeongeupia chitinilytica]GHD55258.1 cell envelope biogenesis protein AsmA [Jeongeupia chitinilytica]
MDLRHSRPFRIFLLLIAGLTLLIGIVPYFVEATLLRDALTSQIASETRRTLTVAGNTRVVLLPRPAITLGNVTLSQPDSAQRFMHAERVRVRLALWPLLRGKPVIDQVEFDDPELLFERFADGTYNFEDLLATPEHPRKVDMRLDALHFERAKLVYRDALIGVGGTVSALDFSLDNLADPKNGRFTAAGKLSIGDGKTPWWSGSVEASAAMRYTEADRRLSVAELRFELKQQGATKPGVDIEASGLTAVGNLVYGWQPLRLAGGELKITGNGRRAGQDWQGELNLPSLKVTENTMALEQPRLSVRMQSPRGRFAAGVSVPQLSGTLQGLMRADNARINVELVTPQQTLALNFVSPLELYSGTLARLTSYRLSGQYGNKALPRGAIPFELAGNAALNLRNETIRLDSQGSLDHAPLKATFSIDDFVSPRYGFDVDLADLDLTPYLPAVAAGAKNVSATAPMDFQWLDRLDAQGQVKIGELTMNKLHFNDIALGFVARAHKLALDPLAANVYGGQLSGRLEIDNSRGGKPRWHASQRLNNMNINMLLSDLLDTSRFEGRGHLNLDVSAVGDTLTDLRRTAGGDVRVQLSKGSVRGIDIEALLRTASRQIKAMNGEVTQLPNLDARTRFSELNATLQLKHGVATNNDLLVRAGVLRLAGGGTIDLGAGQVDYRLKASANPDVPELKGIVGLTLPIEFSGPLNGPTYHVDYTSLKNQLLERQKAEEEAQAKAREAEAARKAAEAKAAARAAAKAAKPATKPAAKPAPKAGR